MTKKDAGNNFDKPAENKKAKTGERQTLGKLPPRYRFFLNPYLDFRFSSCPECNNRMRQRKLPLFIHIAPRQPVILNKTCKYCPNSELLVVNQDELEKLLNEALVLMKSDKITVAPNDYLVVGTIEPAAWRSNKVSPLSFGEMLDNLHDFKDQVNFKMVGGWGKW